VFENGKSALENLLSSQKLDKAKPDIIFLDINMPIMDGWQFIEQLKKHNLFNDLLIYIVSSSSDPNDLKLAEMNNLKTRILQKPLSSEKLKNIINLHKSKLNKSN
jgi:CheY-like chemotaxis protein